MTTHSQNAETFCPECNESVSWDIPCPNSCEPLAHYLQELQIPINYQEGDEDALLLITLAEVIEMARKLAASDSDC